VGLAQSASVGCSALGGILPAPRKEEEAVIIVSYNCNGMVRPQFLVDASSVTIQLTGVGAFIGLDDASSHSASWCDLNRANQLMWPLIEVSFPLT
jgi:hypothetical protein